jgi:hypothetical protein
VEALSSCRCSIGMLEPQAPARARQACGVPEGGERFVAWGVLWSAATLYSRSLFVVTPGRHWCPCKALKRRRACSLLSLRMRGFVGRPDCEALACELPP